MKIKNLFLISLVTVISSFGLIYSVNNLKGSLESAQAVIGWTPLTSTSAVAPGIVSNTGNSVKETSVVKVGANTFVAYVIYTSNATKVYVTKFNGTTWMRPTDGNTGTPYDEITATGLGFPYYRTINLSKDSTGRVYLTFEEYNSGTTNGMVNVTYLENAGSAWKKLSDGTNGYEAAVTIATTFGSDFESQLYVDSTDVPWIVYNTPNGTLDIYVTKFVGGSWKKPSDGVTAGADIVSSSANASTYGSLVVIGGVPYVTWFNTGSFAAGGIRASKLVGGVWVKATDGTAGSDQLLVGSGSNNQLVSIVDSAGLPFIVYKYGTEYRASVLSTGAWRRPTDGSTSPNYSVIDTLTAANPQCGFTNCKFLSVDTNVAGDVFVSWMKDTANKDIYISKFKVSTTSFVKPSDDTAGIEQISNTTGDSFGGDIYVNGGDPVIAWRDNTGLTDLFNKGYLFIKQLTEIGVCGDGSLNLVEECDDGNVANGDACTSSCLIAKPNQPTLSVPADGGTVASLTPTLTMSATDNESNTLQYKLRISRDSACNTTVVEYNQTVSTVGWGSTSFASGAPASITVPTALAVGSYYWCAFAIDPTTLNPGTGSNTFSVKSAVRSFTIDNGVNWWKAVFSGSASGGGISGTAVGSSIKPSVVVSTVGDEYLAWAEKNAGGNNFEIKVAKRPLLGTGIVKLSDGTPGFDDVSNTATTSTCGYDCVGLDIVVDGSGNVYVAWNEYEGANKKLRITQFDGVSWKNPVTELAAPVPYFEVLTTTQDVGNPKLTFKSASNEIFLAWEDRTSGSTTNIFITKFNNTTNVFSKPSTGSTSPYIEQMTTFSCCGSTNGATQVDVAYNNVTDELFLGYQQFNNGNKVTKLSGGVWKRPTDNGTTPIYDALAGGASDEHVVIAFTSTGTAYAAYRYYLGTGNIALTKLDTALQIWKKPSTGVVGFDLVTTNPSVDGNNSDVPNIIIDNLDRPVIIFKDRDITASPVRYNARVAMFDCGIYKGPASNQAEGEIISDLPIDMQLTDIAYNPTTNTAFGVYNQFVSGSNYDIYYKNLVMPASLCAAVCGNTVVEAPEACDDGNVSNTDACLNTCILPTCGDTFIRTGFETCDDGNVLNGDGCSSVCATEAVCGNSITEAPEACDDGNVLNGDGCSASCSVEAALCGNAIIQGVEACDDGNTISGDGCSSVCTIETTSPVSPPPSTGGGGGFPDPVVPPIVIGPGPIPVPTCTGSSCPVPAEPLYPSPAPIPDPGTPTIPTPISDSFPIFCTGCSITTPIPIAPYSPPIPPSPTPIILCFGSICVPVGTGSLPPVIGVLVANPGNPNPIVTFSILPTPDNTPQPSPFLSDIPPSTLFPSAPINPQSPISGSLFDQPITISQACTNSTFSNKLLSATSTSLSEMCNNIVVQHELYGTPYEELYTNKYLEYAERGLLQEFDDQYNTIGIRDSDGDGLSDAIELNIGTDPFNKDSDFDRFTDSDENKFYTTNPNDPASVPSEKILITNIVDGSQLSDDKPLVIGVASPAANVGVEFINEGIVVLKGNTRADALGKWVYTVSDTLKPGSYIIRATENSKETAISEYKVNVTLLPAISLPAPIITKVVIKDGHATAYGETLRGTNVDAYFASLLQGSSLIADSASGNFVVTSPMILEQGNHTFYATATSVDGRISPKAEYTFTVGSDGTLPVVAQALLGLLGLGGLLLLFVILYSKYARRYGAVFYGLNHVEYKNMVARKNRDIEVDFISGLPTDQRERFVQKVYLVDMTTNDAIMFIVKNREFVDSHGAIDSSYKLMKSKSVNIRTSYILVNGKEEIYTISQIREFA